MLIIMSWPMHLTTILNIVLYEKNLIYKHMILSKFLKQSIYELGVEFGSSNRKKYKPEMCFAASVFHSTVPCPGWISKKQPVITNFIITFGQMSLECDY